ncbi:MAG: type II toxin-antitoxin system HicB family antitoxin [Candidatus Riflebacteria bacterium]|nr:type II toxin-antitoxin system HicB family antitoxin [Candidatus Riflebacteria bacterium]
MLTKYIEAALKHAKYELLEEDNCFYGEIPEFIGVYATADNLESCRNELVEVLEEWVLFRIYKHLDLPTVDGHELRIIKYIAA